MSVHPFASVIVKITFLVPIDAYFTDATLDAVDVAGLAPEPKFQEYVDKLLPLAPAEPVDANPKSLPLKHCAAPPVSTILASGFPLTSTEAVNVSVQLFASVTVKVTYFVPAVAYDTPL